jgi:hypothetical protein
MADTDYPERPQCSRKEWNGILGNDGGVRAVADRNGGGFREQRSDGLLDGQRAPSWRDADGPHLPLFPPAPDDAAGWGQVLERWPGLAPAIAPVRGVADGMAPRVQRLKALGNGQVPLAAAAAWVMLGGPWSVT